MIFLKKRIGRLTFFNYLSILLLSFIIVMELGSLFGLINSDAFSFLILSLLALGLFYVSALRLHDINANTISALIPLLIFSNSPLALVSLLFILFLGVKSGNKRDNKYGSPPKRAWPIGLIVCCIALYLYIYEVHDRTQRYRKRVYVAEGIGLAASAKSRVLAYCEEHGTFPKAKDILQNEKISGNAVNDVKIEDKGRITIYYNSKVKENGYITIFPTLEKEFIKWKCEKTNLDEATLPAIYRGECGVNQ